MKIHVITAQDNSVGRSTSSFVKGQLTINCGFEGGMGKAPFVLRLQNTDRNSNGFSERDEVLINLDFAEQDGLQFWSGTFRDLQKAITPQPVEKQFPNGFASWMETHHEIVAHLTSTVDFSGSAAHFAISTGGTGRLYELAEDLTDKFEQQFKGHDWDGDFFDHMGNFLAAADLEAALEERRASK